ncbi:MAG TPA: retropepsin-like aspartic protease [Kofleriaceae bacterium]|nr:retropepsin-like aspartic protease [Kofleriaceae bacterium]
MRSVRFDPDADLIRVGAFVAGRSERRAARLALDTASSTTILTPEFVTLLGYDQRDVGRRTVIRSAIGSEPGYLLQVKRFTALGLSIADLTVHAHSLPAGYDIDGLLGLSFLRHFNLELRIAEGLSRVERAVPVG